MWRVRTWLLILAFSAVGIGLMLWRHQPQQLLGAGQRGLEAVGAVVAPATQSAGTTLPPPPKGKLHKCVAAGGRSLYTDGPCPDGMQAQQVSGGSVTVVRAAPTVATSAKAASAAASNVRDLLLGSDMDQLREKRMQSIIQD